MRPMSRKKLLHVVRGGGKIRATHGGTPSEERVLARPKHYNPKSLENLRRGGSPGRPKKPFIPDPNRIPDVREMFLELFSSDAYKQSLYERIMKGRAPRMEMLGYEYLWGRPKQEIDATVHHEFSFVGFLIDGAINGDPLRVPTQVQGKVLPSADALLDVGGEGEASGNGVASPLW